ncbi:TetR/AcrR family transcriptional regulator [Rhodococcus erythropolis]|uniref:TetR/AcrR family transcriptional regulator n=1 Tax=Rhodococcus erythropolis TaxID=1833 RepID=UPI00294A60E5|nr:TetR/AcrR family transcriptional regulator [Rhodococcus erythropolis]MDV6212729.1 TetR/AcrR family transcriptional regulator [Rhodococcus erythropolis]
MARSMILTRSAVLESASKLFANRGYHGTSMRDIAGSLGVSAPNLYNHLSSKQDALVEIMNTAMDRGLAAMELALDGVEDVGDQLFRATESVVEQFLAFTDDVTVCSAELYCLEDQHREGVFDKRRRYTGRILDIIENGCATGRFRTQVPHVAGFAVVEMGNSAKSWFRPGGEMTAGDLARHYGEFALRIVGDTGER